MSWDTPKCPRCPHPVHESHCPTVACGCHVAPALCAVCGHHEDQHRQMDGVRRCFAWGVRSPCPCGQQGITTREQFQQWALGPEGRNR